MCWGCFSIHNFTLIGTIIRNQAIHLQAECLPVSLTSQSNPCWRRYPGCSGLPLIFTSDLYARKHIWVVAFLWRHHTQCFVVISCGYKLHYHMILLKTHFLCYKTSINSRKTANIYIIGHFLLYATRYKDCPFAQ